MRVGQGRARARATVAVAALVAMSGCWLQPGGGPANARHNGLETRLTVENVGSLAQDWAVLSNDNFWEPVVDGGLVFASRQSGSSDGSGANDLLGVEARHTATGDLAWQRSVLPDGPAAGTVTTASIVDGAVWFSYVLDGMADCTSVLERLDPATGAVIGSEVTTGEVAGAVVGAGGVAAHATRACDGSGWQLTVRDSATAEVLWTHAFAGQPAGPSVADGRVLAVAEERLHAFPAAGCGAATCAPTWTYEPPAGGLSGRPVAMPGGRVLAGAYDRAGPPERPFIRAFAHVVSAADGTGLWQTAIEDPGSASVIQGMAVDGDTIFVTGSTDVYDPATDRLAAYPLAGCGAATCTPAGTAPVGQYIGPAGPVVGGGVVYLDAGGVRAYDADGCGAATCGELHHLPLQGSPRGLSLSGGRLYVAFFSGTDAYPGLAAYAP